MLKKKKIAFDITRTINNNMNIKLYNFYALQSAFMSIVFIVTPLYEKNTFR